MSFLDTRILIRKCRNISTSNLCGGRYWLEIKADCIRIDTDELRQKAISATVGVMCKHQQSTATMEGNDSPAATPPNLGKVRLG